MLAGTGVCAWYCIVAFAAALASASRTYLPTYVNQNGQMIHESTTYCLCHSRVLLILQQANVQRTIVNTVESVSSCCQLCPQGEKKRTEGDTN
jgi:hypothetical protein